MSFPKPDENLHLTDSVSDYRTVALGTGSDVCLPSAPGVVQFLVMWWHLHDPKPLDTHSCLALYTCIRAEKSGNYHVPRYKYVPLSYAHRNYTLRR